MIANVGAVLKCRLVDKNLTPLAGSEGTRVQVISDGPKDEPASVWAVTYGVGALTYSTGSNRFVLVKRDGTGEPAKWVGRLT